MWIEYDADNHKSGKQKMWIKNFLHPTILICDYNQIQICQQMLNRANIFAFITIVLLATLGHKDIEKL